MDVWVIHSIKIDSSFLSGLLISRQSSVEKADCAESNKVKLGVLTVLHQFVSS
jgi:hypothetical protein